MSRAIRLEPSEVEMNNGTPSAGFGFTPIGKIKAKRLRWLIEGIIPKGVLVFIAAQPKEGKSLLALYLSLCLTIRKLFLSQFKTRRSRVLYYSLEDHLGEVKGRAQHLLEGFGVKRFPRYLLMSDATTVNLPEDCHKIEADIRATNADVVVIDTLRRAHGRDEDSSTELNPIIQQVRRWVREYQITVIIIHHAGHKIKDKENPGDWLRGSSDLNAAWEALIGLERFRGGVKARVFHKYRSDFTFTYETVKGEQLDKETGDYPITGLKLCLSSEDEQDDQTVAASLEDGPLSGNDLERRLKGKLSRPRIDATLKRLNGKDAVRQAGQGKNSKWELIRPAA